MTKLLPLHHCQTKEDALYLRNRIQQTISVPVFVQRKETGYMLVISDYAYKKAKVIVEDKLLILPSVLSSRSLQNATSSFKDEKAITRVPRFENLFLDLFSQLKVM